MRSSPVRQKGPAFRLALLPAACAAYLVLTAFLGLYGAGWLAFRGGTREALASAARIDRLNPTYQYLLAKSFHMDLNEPSEEEAVAHYRASLRVSPLQPGAWIDLSKALRSTGDSSAAEHALERALRLSPSDGMLHWEAGTFWLTAGKQDKALGALRKHLSLMPENQYAVYDLGWKLGIPGETIRNDLVPASYEYRSKYLAYLLAAKRTEEARQVWGSLPEEDIEKKVFLSYVDYLIKNSQYGEARAVWENITAKIKNTSGKDVAPESPSPVWNGGFEKEVLNGGFDWRVFEPKGVKVFIDDAVRMSGDRSLGVSFDGGINPHIAFAQQVVLVRPGASYRLAAYVKTENLTSSNGVYLRVTGMGDCKGLLQGSSPVTGTHLWHEVSFEFSVPAGCEAAVLELRRDQSLKFDNKIEGTAWIDGITLKPLSALPKQSSGKP